VERGSTHDVENRGLFLSRRSLPGDVRPPPLGGRPIAAITMAASQCRLDGGSRSYCRVRQARRHPGTACRTARDWGGIGVPVNLSPIQFRDRDLVQKVRSALQDSGLPSQLLELEITEGVLLEDAANAREVLEELKSLGIKLAMDDFGTGYSSLSYLRNFPFDVIKIDRSFTMDLDSSDNARPIVQAILGLGKALGLSVTAEGVETNEQLAILTADQCNEIQGYLMSRPLKSDQVTDLLKEIDKMVERKPVRKSV
jgi:EAL domain-containing protein (putative c-di-GMP-specific phosphodiesterase class I)